MRIYDLLENSLDWDCNLGASRQVPRYLDRFSRTLEPTTIAILSVDKVIPSTSINKPATIVFTSYNIVEILKILLAI